MYRGRLYVHRLHILLALLDITPGNHGGIHAFLHRFLNDFVIHIREVGYIIYFKPLVFHITPYRIKYDHRPGIPDMDQIINRRPADIHPYLSLFDRHKFLFFL